MWPQMHLGKCGVELSVVVELPIRKAFLGVMRFVVALVNFAQNNAANEARMTIGQLG